MSEIPDDIMQAARKLCDHLIKAWLGHYTRDEAAESAAKFLSDFSQRDQWQPIETAPCDGSDILVCLTHNISADEWVTIQWVDYQVPGAAWPVCESRIDIPFKPTMWRPLPAPPNYEEG